MNYIYDVLANFDKEYFEFYEWNQIDNIIHIKKLPILKISTKLLNDIKKYDVIIQKKMLEKIYHKTEYFKEYKTLKLDYVCAITDSKEAIIINIKENGTIIGKSSLLIDEENEILDISEKMPENEYEYKIKEKKQKEIFKTRKEIFINKYITEELKNINKDKLKYLYFECFNTPIEDTKLIEEKLTNEINNNFYNVYDKIYNFLKLTSINK